MDESVKIYRSVKILDENSYDRIYKTRVYNITFILYTLDIKLPWPAWDPYVFDDPMGFEQKPWIPIGIPDPTCGIEF